MSSNPAGRAGTDSAWLRTGLRHQPTGRSGHGDVLADDADRECAVNVLKSGYAEGRLSKDEFDARVSRALTARTLEDLTAAAAGLPWWPGRPVPLSRAERHPGPGTGRAVPGCASVAGEGQRSGSGRSLLACLLITSASFTAMGGIHHFWPGSTAAYVAETIILLSLVVGMIRFAVRMICGR